MNIPVPWSIGDPHTKKQFVEPISDKIQPNQSFGDAWGFHYRKLCKKLRFRQLRQHHGAFFWGDVMGMAGNRLPLVRRKGEQQDYVFCMFFSYRFLLFGMFTMFFLPTNKLGKSSNFTNICSNCSKAQAPIGSDH